MKWQLYIISIFVFLIISAVIYTILTYVVFIQPKIPRYLAVKVATCETLDLKKTQSIIDNVILNPNDRLLVKNQLHNYENGIYELTHSYHLKRAKDMQSPNQVYIGTFVYVTDGTINSKTSWLLQVDYNYYTEFPEMYFTNIINANSIKQGLALYYNNENELYEWNELPTTNIEPIDFKITMNLKNQTSDKYQDIAISTGSVTIPISKTTQLGEYRCIIYTDNRDWCCTSIYIINSNLFHIYEDTTVSNTYKQNLRLYKSSKNTLKIRYILPQKNIKTTNISVRFIST
jgi:hypothetical protein